MSESNWYFNNAELIGVKHSSSNEPCQDHTQCAEKDGVRVIALSDGCGSSGLSHFGAHVTTDVICNLFTERFDDISKMDQSGVRKIIIDSIGIGLEKYIDENPELFDNFINANPDKYEEFTRRFSREEFLLDSLNATILFVAGKDNLFFIGAVGDGTVGAVIDNKLKIVLEEKKDAEVNGTRYPSTIYSRAKNNPIYYNDSHFQIKRVSNGNFSAFVLLCDGADALLDKRVPFQKKFSSGVDKIFRATVDFKDDPQQARSILQDQLMPMLVRKSSGNDDCSVAVLVREDYIIDEYVVEIYERPPINETPEDEMVSKISRQKQSILNMFSIDRTSELNDFLVSLDECAYTLEQKLGFVNFYRKILNDIKVASDEITLSDVDIVKESYLNFIYMEERFLTCRWTSDSVKIRINSEYIDIEIRNNRLNPAFVLFR